MIPSHRSTDSDTGRSQEEVLSDRIFGANDEQYASEQTQDSGAQGPPVVEELIEDRPTTLELKSQSISTGRESFPVDKIEYGGSERREVDTPPTAGATPKIARGPIAFLGRSLDGLLDRMAEDPNGSVTLTKTFGRIGIDFLPWIGPIKKIADARALAKTDDPSRMREAEGMFVLGIATFILILQCQALPHLFQWDEAATSWRHIMRWARNSLGSRSLPKLLIDTPALAISYGLSLTFTRPLVQKLLKLGIPDRDVPDAILK